MKILLTRRKAALVVVAGYMLSTLVAAWFLTHRGKVQGIPSTDPQVWGSILGFAVLMLGVVGVSLFKIYHRPRVFNV